MDKSPSRDERAWREALMKELARRKLPPAWQARRSAALRKFLADGLTRRRRHRADLVAQPGLRRSVFVLIP